MRQMLRDVGETSRSTYLVRYEELCQYPYRTFAGMADFLGFDWTKASEETLLETTTHDVPPVIILPANPQDGNSNL